MMELRDSNEDCPNCEKNLQGDPIPEKDHEAYGATHFSLKISIYDRGLDRTIAWECPYCMQRWPRSEPIKAGFLRTIS